MQGLPRHNRRPGEILGVNDKATLEELRQAYLDARERALRGASLTSLPEPDQPDLPDVEWAYRELLAGYPAKGNTRASADDDDDDAVSAVLLPGLSSDTVESLSLAQNNVVKFTGRREGEGNPPSVKAAPRANGRAPSRAALDDQPEDEDFTIIPFHDSQALILEESPSAGDVGPEGFGIPELRDALERAAAAVETAPLNVRPTQRPPGRPPAQPGAQKGTTPKGHSARHAQTPRVRPPIANPAIIALTRERDQGGASFADAAASLRAAPASAATRPPPNMVPPKTIRTVIGGEEKLVVSVVARRAQEPDMQERIRTLLDSSERIDGSLLRTLRTTLGVEVAEVCLRIRIPPDQLAAMEEDAFDRLPAPVYYRGFVVSYLKYLGVERLELADALTENYRAQLRARYFRGMR
jgi:hypothetical protein